MAEILSSALAVLDLLADGCALVDAEGKIAYLNSAAFQLLGPGARAAVGLPVEGAFPADASAAIRSSQRWASAGVLCGGDGEGQSLESGGLVFRWRRTPQGWLVTFNDARDAEDCRRENVELKARLAQLESTMKISQELLRNNNLELNRSLERLQEMNSQLGEATRLKAEFFANTSHELRTPLNAIIGSLALLMDGLCDTEEERNGYIQDSLGRARNLLDLINDVLEIQKIEGGKADLVVGEVDARTLFEDLMVMMSPRAQAAGLELGFTIEDSSVSRVKSDTNSLRKILVNLIGNGIKFTSNGSVRVSLSPYPGDPSVVVFAVEDSGVGIPEEHHEKVFEKFFQVDGSSTRRHEGTGLGLALCKTLVQMLGGTIWIVKGRAGHGTKVCFTQPVFCPEAEAEDLAAAGAGADETFSSSF